MRISMSPPHYYKKSSVYAFSHFPARSLYTLSFRTLINKKRASLDSRRLDSYSVLFINFYSGLESCYKLVQSTLLNKLSYHRKTLLCTIKRKLSYLTLPSVHVNAFLPEMFVQYMVNTNLHKYRTALNNKSLS